MYVCLATPLENKGGISVPPPQNSLCVWVFEPTIFRELRGVSMFGLPGMRLLLTDNPE